MAQRLVKTLCPGGGKKMAVGESMGQMLTKEFEDLPKEYAKNIPSLKEVYRINPTPECPSGTRGRIAVFETFEMNPDLEKAILAGKPEEEMFAVVRLEGMLTMKEDSIIKSAKGIIPFEEVNTLGGQFELPEDTGVGVPKVVSAVIALEETDPVADTETKEIEV